MSRELTLDMGEPLIRARHLVRGAFDTLPRHLTLADFIDQSMVRMLDKLTITAGTWRRVLKDRSGVAA